MTQVDWSFLAPAVPLPKMKTKRFGIIPARPENMERVYMMGFDAWGDADRESEYLAACRNSEKYQRGTWYLATDSLGEAVSSLICYELPQLLPFRVIGVGSIATMPNRRRTGAATELLKEVVSGYFSAVPDTHGFMLFPDSKTSIYQKLGFMPVPCGASLSPVPKPLFLWNMEFMNIKQTEDILERRAVGYF
jgi:hypothetical protein